MGPLLPFGRTGTELTGSWGITTVPCAALGVLAPSLGGAGWNPPQLQVEAAQLPEEGSTGSASIPLVHSHSIHSSLKGINFPSGYPSSPFPTCQGEQDPLSRAGSWALGGVFYLNHLLCSLLLPEITESIRARHKALLAPFFWEFEAP